MGTLQYHTLGVTSWLLCTILDDMDKRTSLSVMNVSEKSKCFKALTPGQVLNIEWIHGAERNVIKLFRAVNNVFSK